MKRVALIAMLPEVMRTFAILSNDTKGSFLSRIFSRYGRNGGFRQNTKTFLCSTTGSMTVSQELEPSTIFTLLADLTQLVEGIASSEGGTILNSFNGTVCAAFDTAPAALRAAELALDRSAREIIYGFPVTLHFGLHTGSLFTTRNRFFSSSINTANRIASFSSQHGVLMSEATAGLVGVHLGDARQIQQLGTIVLTGRMEGLNIFTVTKTADVLAGEKKVFISYRRDGGSELARLIANDLQRRGIETLLDLDNFGSSHFDEQIYRRIDEARNLVLVLSKGSLDRCNEPDDWLCKEIAYALAQQKNIVPVLEEGFVFPGRAQLPDELGELPRHNAIQYSHEYFAAVMDRLTGFLKTEAGSG